VVGVLVYGNHEWRMMYKASKNMNERFAEVDEASWSWPVGT
jgi:hypothetical protein